MNREQLSNYGLSYDDLTDLDKERLNVPDEQTVEPEEPTTLQRFADLSYEFGIAMLPVAILTYPQIHTELTAAYTPSLLADFVVAISILLATSRVKIALQDTPTDTRLYRFTRIAVAFQIPVFWYNAYQIGITNQHSFLLSYGILPFTYTTLFTITSILCIIATIATLYTVTTDD